MLQKEMQNVDIQTVGLEIQAVSFETRHFALICKW